MEVRPLPTQIHTHPVEAGFRPAKAEARSARPRRPEASEPVTIRPRRPGYLAVRAAVERVAGLVLLVLALPVIGLAALAVRLTSRGPAFYTQVRVGLRGERFRIYKLRTMMHNCESLTGPRWSMPGDPRVTPAGRFLRATHLDELPQLVNVVRGEMSLIGPRPERPEFLPELTDALPAYAQRLWLRPGVTGLAQVQLPADTDLDSVHRKLAYDLYYVREASLWLDLRILFATTLYAAGVSYGTIRRLFALPDAAAIERGVQAALTPGMPGRQRLSA
jgi:lipopolysaccharide/colanic/teichoic acid biosynthesis glycosyltransferase